MARLTNPNAADAALRGALALKPISGELRVFDAERIVGTIEVEAGSP